MKTTSDIEILIGDEVFQLLSDPEFQHKWDTLYELCAWGTVFQSRNFVSTWYQVYAKQYLPILVKRELDNNLTGILALAKDKTNLITGAGVNQAEYQVWLATPDDSAFIQEALKLILKRFAGFKIQLKYLPGNTTLEWLKSDLFLAKKSFLRTVDQPLVIIESEKVNIELKKKNRREKLNRLRRIGELEFEHITDIERFIMVLDELALQYDFRKESMFNINFFNADTFRKEFLIELFKKKLLHTTLLTLNGEIIASNVGAKGKNCVHLQGINTHSPMYAKYSPGILHFLMLCKLLGEEGIATFDLTPGSDTYKYSLATDSVIAYQLTISSNFGKIKDHVKYKSLNFFKERALRFGISAQNIRLYKKSFLLFKERAKKTREQGVLKTIKDIYNDVRKINKSETIYINADSLKFPFDSFRDLKKCSLSDILKYKQNESLLTRWEFLEQAMNRLESGEICYTWCENNQLQTCVWIGGTKSTTINSKYKNDCAYVLQGVYCHPSGIEKLNAFLQAVATEVIRENRSDEICAVIIDKTTSWQAFNKVSQLRV